MIMNTDQIKNFAVAFDVQITDKPINPQNQSINQAINQSIYSVVISCVQTVMYYHAFKNLTGVASLPTARI